MKALKTLIKLHKSNLDEKRKQKANLENQKEQLNNLILKLKTELISEQKFCSKNIDLIEAYNNYADYNRDRQLAIIAEIEKLDKQIDSLTEEIFNEFTELKKYQVALQNKVKELNKQQAIQEEKSIQETIISKEIRKSFEEI
jgi:hypothetical protein